MDPILKHLKLLAIVLATGMLASCGSANNGRYYDRDGPPSAYGHAKALGADSVELKVEQPHKWANRPYKVMGKRYYPVTGDKATVEVGVASWYGKQFHGKKTAIGEKYDMYALSAAHPTMELPSYARVTNLNNGRSVIVRVNDRGPFVNSRIIDMSYAAAVKLGYQKQGTARVRVERITRKAIARGEAGKAGAASSASSSEAKVQTRIERIVAGTSAAATRRESKTVPSAASRSSRVVSAVAAAAAPAAAVVAARPAGRSDASTGEGIRETASDPMADLIDQERNWGEPTAVMTLEVESVDEGNGAGTGGASPRPAGVPSAATQQGRTGDAIAAILSQSLAAHAGTQPGLTDDGDAAGGASENRQPSGSEFPDDRTPLEQDTPPGPWSVQIGAFSMRDSALSSAAHAENLLDQESIAPVVVVPSGSLFKIFAGRADDAGQAAALARRVADKLGFKTIPVHTAAP